MTTSGYQSAARVIVIPRQLEEYFHERLTQHFTGRPDVKVVVDRRVGDRRRDDRWVSGPGPLAERRRGERRAAGISWKLDDMPFSTAERSALR